MDWTDEQRRALTVILNRLERGITFLANDDLLLMAQTQQSGPTDQVIVLCLNYREPVPYGYARKINMKVNPELACLRSAAARLRALLSP